MNNFFTVYSLTDCPYCKKAINLLDSKNFKFVVTVMDKNEQFISKIKQETNMKTVPIIIHHLQEGNKIVGGSDDLENYLNSPEFKND